MCSGSAPDAMPATKSVIDAGQVKIIGWVDRDQAVPAFQNCAELRGTVSDTKPIVDKRPCARLGSVLGWDNRGG